MGRSELKAWGVLAARLGLAATFALAALPKIQDPGAFAEAVERYRVFGPTGSRWVAVTLPWLELVAGFGLLTPFLRRASGCVLAALLVAFLGLHAVSWARGLDIACGCFAASGAEAAANYPWLLARNAALLVLSLAVLRRDWQVHGSRREGR